MAITLVDDWNDRDAWDDFVDRHEQGRFCHLFGYGDVIACYGYRPARIAFLTGGNLVAVLPAALAASLLFGRKLVSQPFSEYGGLLVDRTLGRDDMGSIYALLGDYLKRNARLRVLELHGGHGILATYRPGPFVLLNPHHVAILALDQPVDRLWQNLEPALRNKVNKAQANGVVAFEECNLALIRERFYPLYLLSMKRLGVPPHPLAYYTRCLEFLGARLKIFWAARNGEVLAAILGFVCGGRVSIINTVSNPDSWKYAPNDLMHWEFIKWAAVAGLKYFDFGSVRYDGQRNYKKKWGVAFEEHGYYLLSRDPTQAARATFDSSSDRMTGMAKLWSNYMPASVAQFAGPVIRKHLVR